MEITMTAHTIWEAVIGIVLFVLGYLSGGYMERRKHAPPTSERN
jgi:hypothetical protein